MLPDLPVVLVQWVDACSVDPWQQWDDLEVGVLACRTLGWLVADEDDFIAVAGSINQNQACGIMSIPRECIKSITRIKVDEAELQAALQAQ